MRSTLIAAAAIAALAGCSTYDSVSQKIAQSITPYRITIVQGNFVSSEMAAQMKIGMTRDQVRRLLGTPLLTDMFHADRWDYVFYFKRGSTSVVQQRDFIVNFGGDTVSSWSGGEDLPSNLELLADIDGDRKGKKVAAPKPASAPAAASGIAALPPATAASSATSTQDATRSPSTDAAAAAAALPDTSPNAQAAAAANRATEAVQAPTGRQTPSVRAGNPSVDMPPGTISPATPQIQLQRPPQPTFQGQGQENPVGPTGSGSGDSGAPNNNTNSTNSTTPGTGS
ncbi:outer membrane protein assembly factor BamE [Paraburkholderia phosphatilytica]|uniref:outer membrane protein assembly factor BamE n=1 Tax=Paraburkholderia phosphatilytica TaxID=2282883 RepID=UPI001F0CA973|nr:outer membrane protein assembly factor BamE [Paraburkholderia phosphatilytica]